MKKTWWKESVVYEIYPRSFYDSNGDGIGDLNGVTEKLAYLKDLGIDVIWLAPICKSPNDDNGYDVSDYRDIQPEFGTMEDFHRLLEKAHSYGIKIMVDMVLNHSSDEHAWFLESRSSKENEKRDYYIWREAVNGKEPTNWGSAFGGSAWEWDEQTNMYYLHCFSKKQPDLNWKNPKVRKELYDIVRFWCEKGVDGFRFDVISRISKPDVFKDTEPIDGKYGWPEKGPLVHEYLREMRREVLSKYDVMTVGECGGVDTDGAKVYANSDGSELNMIFQFEHINIDNDENGKWCKIPMNLPKFKKNLEKWQKELDETSWNSIYINNHDQPRVVSRIGDDSPKSAKAIAMAMYHQQGTPYLYQGEELGMTNYPFHSIDEYDDIESISAYRKIMAEGKRDEEEVLEAIAYKSRENSRTPMQWSDEKNAGFTTGTPWLSINPNYEQINAREQMENPDSVFHFYKKMLAMRKDDRWKDVIVYGKFELFAENDENIFAYIRYTETKKLLVLCNLSAEEAEFELPDSIAADTGKLILSNDTDRKLERQMLLRPWEAALYQIEP